MKIITLILLTFFSFKSFSASIKITGACSATPFIESKIKPTEIKKNIGLITINFLNENKIEFIGDEQAITSIENSATGDNAIEVVSATEMRVYGWCYTINDTLPESLPNEVFLTNLDDSISWFYAYSSYIKGEWKNYCTPAHTIPNSIFCSKK